MADRPSYICNCYVWTRGETLFEIDKETGLWRVFLDGYVIIPKERYGEFLDDPCAHPGGSPLRKPSWLRRAWDWIKG